MPPSSRSRSTTRRSPRPAPRAPLAPVAGSGERPQLVPFAAVFGLVVAGEDGYLTWLLSSVWFLVVPLVIALAALAGAVLVWLGRRPGWALLVVAAVVTLLGLLAVAVLFALLGGGAAFWSAVLLLVGPIGCLALTLRAPVRSWRGGGPATRSPGGRRAPGRSR